MLNDAERAAIARLWARKTDQDARGLPRTERHRNIEPDAAELIHVLALGCHAQRLLEVGGSSGLSTIALAAAARATGGRLVSIEIEPVRQEESRQTLATLGLAGGVELVCADARAVLPQRDGFDFVLIDCEKDDYVAFFDLLKLAPGAIVVADNIHSHGLWDYVRHVRARPGVESITLAVGKGLEVSRVGGPAPGGRVVECD
jgi:predicted O-methyltransferase YrrM